MKIAKLNLPGKQSLSSQVKTRTHILPSPEYPAGHGPHFGPSAVSLHSTPKHIRAGSEIKYRCKHGRHAQHSLPGKQGSK